MRTLPAPVALLVLIGCALPQSSVEAQPPDATKFVPFSYYRSGNGFGCVAPGSSTGNPWVCNRIGALVVRSPLEEATRILGPPARSIRRDAEKTDHLFPRGPAGYVVATAARGVIVGLQVTGSGPLPDWTFSGIGLGTTSGALRARLGEPIRTSAVAPEGSGLWKDGAELWSYPPWSFDFEIAHDRVISIRVGLD